MACMIKTRIRLDKVYTRLNKITYRRLKPNEYRLIKFEERIDRLIRDMNKFWRYYDKDGKACVEGNDWDYFLWLDKEFNSACKRRDKEK